MFFRKDDKTMNIQLFLQKHSSTILSCISAAGVVATTIMTSKATVKAIDILESEELDAKEKFKKAAPIYAPAAAVGAGTVACIFGSNVLSTRSQASIISAYAVANRAYKQYRNKIIDICGTDAEKQIRDEIIIDEANPPEEVECFEDLEGTAALFYEPISHTCFYSTVGNVMRAEYQLNRTISVRGYIYLNEFYDLLGIDTTPEGEKLGWVIEDEDYWVDFDHRKVTLKDGRECYVIEAELDPSYEMFDYHYN